MIGPDKMTDEQARTVNLRLVRHTAALAALAREVQP